MVKNQFKESEIGETKRRARYTLAYKMEAVRLIKGGQAVSVTAQILGIPKASLDNWSSSAPKANSRALGTNRSALRKWSWPGCAPSLPTSLSDVEQPGCHGGAQRRGVQNLPPSQIVPRLADQGCYIASESTLYRLLHQVGQMRYRRLERVPHKRIKPRALTATQPDQIYCWDITYLPTCVRGVHFYLYLFVDLFSRKIVG